ncbi:MAG: DUF4870 domain-containing protein [Proteobacteria bacterium]|uniref:DUF4870 domain-containing protein n=1 Tax=Rudaea sp. TaxID=2136325 RepID=UPI001D85AD8A|nr:DUF4870 domain-containing protein [Pseudomonadota bacterium]MBS0567867.1 DUF4870 domain-containing protein [Pseudomonadota bacterium]
MSVPPNEAPSGNGSASSDAVTPPPAPPGMPGAEERQWAMFAHLSALLGAIVTGHMFAWGCFIGPLVIWLIKKDTLPFVDDQAKEALNFNITLAIIGLALLVLSIITLGLGLLLAIPVGVVVGVAWLVLTIIAAVKANEGVAYRYPVSLRLIK